MVIGWPSSDLNRLLFSFHRDHPKSSRNLPKWNLSVVLNELTKAPFDPMKDTDLKHLTLKTAFFLALASGRRCSKIHAWVSVLSFINLLASYRSNFQNWGSVRGTRTGFSNNHSIYYVHPPGGWIYYFCFFRRPMSVVRCPMSGVRRPMSGVTHGFRSFKGKVLELLSPNLVCRLIGSVACLGLLLAVVPLLLTE